MIYFHLLLLQGHGPISKMKKTCLLNYVLCLHTLRFQRPTHSLKLPLVIIGSPPSWQEELFLCNFLIEPSRILTCELESSLKTRKHNNINFVLRAIFYFSFDYPLKWKLKLLWKNVYFLMWACHFHRRCFYEYIVETYSNIHKAVYKSKQKWVLSSRKKTSFKCDEK